MCTHRRSTCASHSVLSRWGSPVLCISNFLLRCVCVPARTNEACVLLSGKAPKVDTVDTDVVVARRISYIVKTVFAPAEPADSSTAGEIENPEGKIHAKLRAAFQPPHAALKKWAKNHTWVRHPPSSGIGGQDGTSKYLSYGVVAYCVDNKEGQKATNILQIKEKETPKVWVCACSASCGFVVDCTGNPKNKVTHMTRSTTINEHLAKHGIGASKDHPRTKHKDAKNKRQDQAVRAIEEKGLSPQRYYQLCLTLMVISKFLSFQISEAYWLRAFAHPDWEPCKAEIVRRSVGEYFLTFGRGVQEQIRQLRDSHFLPSVHLNADLWKSKVSKVKFVGVRIFVLINAMLWSALLAVSEYAPPKDWDDQKEASQWLLEYVVAVLAWYGIKTTDVAGAISDAGSDCKKAFNVHARQKYKWAWSWCWPHCLDRVLLAACGTQAEKGRSSNPQMRELVNSCRKVVEQVNKSDDKLLPPLTDAQRAVMQAAFARA